jgi:hypothetical protein
MEVRMRDGNEIRAEQLLATNRLQWALRDVAANLMRIAGGAGKPLLLLKQLSDLLKAVQTYTRTTGHSPAPEFLADVIAVRPDPGILRTRWSDRALYDAEQQLIEAALHMAAARLLDQRVQEHSGRKNMQRSIDDLIIARGALRGVGKAITLDHPSVSRGKPKPGGR